MNDFACIFSEVHRLRESDFDRDSCQELLN